MPRPCCAAWTTGQAAALPRATPRASNWPRPLRPWPKPWPPGMWPASGRPMSAFVRVPCWLRKTAWISRAGLPIRRCPQPLKRAVLPCRRRSTNCCRNWPPPCQGWMATGSKRHRPWGRGARRFRRPATPKSMLRYFAPRSCPYGRASCEAGEEVCATAEDVADAPEAPLSEEILAKAKELGYDYVRIYEYVRNGIRSEWYAGSIKGALGTLRTGAGNAVDQASL